MRRKPWPKRRKLPWKRLALAAAVMLFAIFSLKTYSGLEELIGLYGETRCRNLVMQTLLDCISESKSGGKLSTFTTVDGKCLIELDHEQLLDRQAKIGKLLAGKLDALGEQTYYVPLGTILENIFLIGQGPDIAIRYVPIGAADISIDSSLEDAGVNQVLYRLVMHVSVDMTVLVPGGTRQVCCTQELVLEEILLTGEVPSIYGE